MTIGRALVAGARERVLALERRKTLLAAPLVFLAVASALLHAAAKPLWYDELCTVSAANEPTWQAMWETAAAVDRQPPLFYVITRAMRLTAVKEELWSRFPAMLGLILLLVTLFAFVSKTTSPSYGLVAASLPLTTTAFAYSYEARPYGLLMGFTGLVFLAWQYSADKRAGRWRVIALGVSSALVASIHYYGGLALFPLGVGELTWSWLHKRVCWSRWAAMAMGPVAVAAQLPFVRSSFGSPGKTPWNPVGSSSIYEVFSFLLAPGIPPLLLAGMICFLLVASSESIYRRQSGELPLPEVMAVASVIVTPLVAYVLASATTHIMSPRYLLTITVGLSIAAAFLLFRITGASKMAALSATGVFVIWMGLGARTLVNSRSDPGIQVSEAFWDLFPRDVSGPIVVANGLDFFQLWHYVGAGRRAANLVYIADEQMANQVTGSDGVDRLLAAPRLALPVRTWRSFRAEHSEFLLLWSPFPYEWVLREAIRERADVSLISQRGERALYRIRF